MTLLRDTRDATSAPARKAAQTKAVAAAVDKAQAAAGLAGGTINDAWITAKVRTHYVGPTLLPDVEVETLDHVVTLTGTVPSSVARERAATLARDTDGVTRVVNQLAVSQE